MKLTNKNMERILYLIQEAERDDDFPVQLNLSNKERANLFDISMALTKIGYIIDYNVTTETFHINKI